MTSQGRSLQPILLASLMRGHELRAAYACERYAQLTGHPAPVLGGTLHRDDRARDRAARQQIAVELGHHRVDVVSAYVGGRR